jgi:TIR domain
MTIALGASDIFISHSSADKPEVGRIVACLQHEFSQLGETLAVFLDRPQDLESAIDSGPRIEAGQKWKDTLDYHLKTCACTLVFWSGKSAKSDWVATEVGTSYDDGRKLFQITLDVDGLKAMAAMPIIREYQAIEFHKFPSFSTTHRHTQRDGEIKHLARKIIAFVKKRRAAERAARFPIPIEQLPNTIDCADQVSAIEARLRMSLGDVAGLISRPPVKRPIFAMAAYDEDSPHSLVSRLRHVELPRVCRSVSIEIGPPDVHDTPLAWPPSGSGRERKIKSAIENRMGSLGRRRDRPILILTELTSPSADDVPLVSSWLQGWDQVLAQHPQSLVIPLLVIVEQAGGWFRRQGLGDPIAETVDAFETETSKGVQLLRLRELERGDADAWCDICLPKDIRDQSGELIAQFIEAKFGRSVKPPRLAQFLKTLNQQSWWKEWKRQNGG